MNLCRLDPKDIYRWFMEMFVDSSDWVMVPNVLEWVHFPMVELFQLNLTFVDQAIC